MLKSERLLLKFFFVIIIPILVILAIGIVLVNITSEEYQEVKKISSLNYITLRINSFVHELQKERSLSLFYIMDGDSLKMHLNEQFNNTSEKLDVFRKSLQDNTNLSYILDTKVYYNELVDDLAKMNIIRDKIQKKDITIEELYTFYTQLIKKVLLEEEKLFTDNLGKQIKKEFLKLLIFSKFTETINEENLLISLFYSNNFNQNLFKYYITLLELQKEYLSCFFQIGQNYHLS